MCTGRNLEVRITHGFRLRRWLIDAAFLTLPNMNGDRSGQDSSAMRRALTTKVDTCMDIWSTQGWEVQHGVLTSAA